MLSRRRMLQGFGAAALALPFLRHIPSAAAATPPKRVLFWFTPNEWIDKAHWNPGVASGAALPMSLPTVYTPLNAHRAKLVIVGDLENKVALKSPEGGGHQATGLMLTGVPNVKFGPGKDDYWAGGISLDQHIASAWGTSALTLGILPGSGSNGNSRISYTGKNEPVGPYDDPQLAFEKTFGDPDLSEADKAAERARQGLVLDAAAANLTRTKGLLPKVDAEKLEHHLEAVMSLKDKLASTGAACTPTPLDVPGTYDCKKNQYVPQTTRLMIDVMVAALACGTRVGSIQLGNSGSNNITPIWPSEGIDISVDCHNISHNYNANPTGTPKANREALETWYAKQFAYLLDKLDATPDGDGSTLLDNTLVVWTKGFATNHKDDPLCYILAGSAGGALTTNRYWSFPDKPHNDLLTSVAQLVGLDVAKFGDPTVCTGPLAI